MADFSVLEDKETRLFYAKLDDLERRARGGIVSHSSFLTPSEAYRAEKYFESKGNKDMICFFGGYFDAQRKQIFLLPEYISDSYEKNDLFDIISDELDSSIVALKVSGSGFRDLNHRDYLGSILSLGIERDTVGDICILDSSHAIVFCCSEVAELLLYELDSIGNDKVKTEKIRVERNMASTQRFQAFTDTVASERLDCVVAAIFNLSREKAQNLIRAGLVEFNYECAQKIDIRVEAGDIISARGFGKYIIRDISQRTKKDRIRLFADKYI